MYQKGEKVHSNVIKMVKPSEKQEQPKVEEIKVAKAESKKSLKLTDEKKAEVPIAQDDSEKEEKEASYESVQDKVKNL